MASTRVVSRTWPSRRSVVRLLMGVGVAVATFAAVLAGCGPSLHRGSAPAVATTTVPSLGAPASRTTPAPLSAPSMAPTIKVSTTSTTHAGRVAPSASTTRPALVPTTGSLPRFLAWYHGGAVVHDPHVALLVWGSGYPTATERAIEHFLGGLHNSAFGAVLAEYFDTQGHINNDITFTGTWVDTQEPSAAPTVEQVQAEVARAISHAGWTVNANAVVVVLLPSGASPSPVGHDSCGYHTAASAGYLRQTAPAIAVAGYPSGACDVGIGGTDGTTLIASHELAEAITDPIGAVYGPSGWWGIGGPPLGEVADACEPTASFLQLSDGGSAVVSDIYGLQQSRCVSFGPNVA
jgi:hypothetical protein